MATIIYADNSNLPDVVAAINGGGAPSEKTTIRILGDCEISSTLELTQAADGTERIIWQGRDAADTVDQEISIDAQGGSFPVWTLTSAANHIWRDIRSTNTDKGSGNPGWLFTPAANDTGFFRCRGDNCEFGWDNNTNPAHNVNFFKCRAHNNFIAGISMPTVIPSTGAGNFIGSIVECESHDNDGVGFFGSSAIQRCLSYNNLDIGFGGVGQICLSCTSYNNAEGGYEVASEFAAVLQDCISFNDGVAGLLMGASQYVELVRFAWFSSVPGAVRIINGGGILFDHTGVLPLASDPFVDAAGANFALNEDVNGGAVCRNLVGHPFRGLPNTLSYHTIGAWQPPSFLGDPGMQEFQFNLVNWGVH